MIRKQDPEADPEARSRTKREAEADKEAKARMNMNNKENACGMIRKLELTMFSLSNKLPN